MSASKLIIHKFDEDFGVKYKLLHFTIEDESNCSAEGKYSDWSEGKMAEKKKESKSSLLVVKIVSDNELDKLNLNISAKQIDASVSSMITSDPSLLQKQLLDRFKRSGEEINYSHNHKSILLNHVQSNTNSRSDISSQLLTNKWSINNTYYLSPLENSLEKVKENNARIMENIQLLNRTLSYTKKKETLDRLIGFPKLGRLHACNTCGKSFVYETGLRRHYLMRHAISEVIPSWQVVWTCNQCFQVWPQKDEALKHSNTCCDVNNMECIQEIKTSSLLQCEFCEKVYTNIPRLLWHTKVHTIANNYECNPCAISFASYKKAEQHWMLCPWLKMYYSFSLPKLLLCNGCDRKFKNYEQLYNHRYKVGHFMTKTYSNDGDESTMGTLVYQCELCSQWFYSVASLRVHKTENHLKQDIGMKFRMDNNINEGQRYCFTKEEEDITHATQELL